MGIINQNNKKQKSSENNGFKNRKNGMQNCVVCAKNLLNLPANGQNLMMKLLKLQEESFAKN